MPQRITDTSRLTIGRFLYDWQNGTYCLLAYARHGDKGVVATVPDINGDAPDLWSIATQHSPSNASHEEIGRWCLCAGWALSNGRPDHFFAASDQQWTLDVRNTLHEIKPHQYGITAYGWHGAYVGILTPEDPDTRERAHRLLKEQSA